MNGQNIKELTRRMIGKLGAPKDAAKLLGVSQVDISQWCNPDHARIIPLDHFCDLNALVGDIGLKELARVRGFEILPIETKPTNPTAAINAAGKLAEDAGIVTHRVIEALSDGAVCPREERELRGLMGTVLNDLHSLDGALR